MARYYRLGDDEKLAHEARAAVAEMRKLVPTLTGFAQAITGKDDVVVVVDSETPRTDGKRILMRPDIRLGRYQVHDTRKCDKRDDEGRQLCPACNVREDVMWTMYHEISHIKFGTFDAVTDIDRVKVMELALEEAGVSSKRAAKIRERLAEADPRSYMEAAKIISPYMPMLVNVLEDIRVNEEMFKARAGLRDIATLHMMEILRNGIEGDDGTVRRWNEAGDNAQAFMAVMLRCLGVEPGDALKREVTDAIFGSDEIGTLLDKMRTARSVRSTYRLAFPLLEAIRKAGYCRAKSDEDEGDDDDDIVEMTFKPSGEPGEDGDDGPKVKGGAPGDGDGKDGDGTKDDTGDDGDKGSGDASDGSIKGEEKRVDEGTDPGDGDGDDDESDDGDAGEGDSEEPDDPTDADLDKMDDELKKFAGHEDLSSMSVPEDESDGDTSGRPGAGAATRDDKVTTELRRAVKQDGKFDRPSDGVLDVQIHSRMPRVRSGSGTFTVSPPSESVMSSSLMVLRRAFENNRRGAHKRDLKSGHVDMRVLGRRVPVEDPRLFAKKTKPGKRDYFVVIGGDISGSTGGRVCELIKASVRAQAELCHRLGIPFAVYMHSGSYSEDHSMGGMLDLAIIEVKSPDQPWDRAAVQRLADVRSYSANLDGHTLEFYRKVADKQRATDKIIMYYTDGAMPCENYTEELAVLVREIETCKRNGYLLVGVGVGNSEPASYGLDMIRLDRIEDIPNLVKGLAERITKMLAAPTTRRRV